jgi:glycosyltransferase involved in cell wall biosynthesis
MEQKVAFIATVFNEEKSIKRFVDSILAQTRLPDEIIIVDGASTDKTFTILSEYEKSHKIIVASKKGNRSVGRNEAIRIAKSPIIVISDAGCVLTNNFIEEIVRPFTEPKVDVVAGYYKGVSSNILEKSLIPYVLVMEDRVDPLNFLPATRSMAVRKKVWEEVGRFEEKFSHNEDYVFAHALKKNGKKIVFQKSAVVHWYPPNNIKRIFVMFYRFAYGDIESRIVRPKVILLLARYLLGLSVVVLALIWANILVWVGIFLAFLMYCMWAISKNYKYINDWRAVYMLPILQLLSDFAVVTGTTLGLIISIWDTQKRH